MFTYKTKVRINPKVIAEILPSLKETYDKLDPTGELRKAGDRPGQKEARSAFSVWNNLYHFYRRLLHMEDPIIPHLKEYDDGSYLIEVTAEAKGNTTRIYFKPSVTSLTKGIRKAIVPIDNDNIFVYFDLKAAEFALRAIQAQDEAALEVYRSGEDIYMHYANLFPEGTPRNTIKTILIANCYGTTAYRVAQQLGITETVAQRLLDSVAQRMPRFTLLKRQIAAYAQRHNGYYSPDGFDQTNLVKVAEVSKNGFDPNLAYSAYTQSALGLIFQKLSTKYLEVQKGVEQTFLSIFDSMIVEIKPENLERYKQFIISHVAPLLPDGFHTGKTMYEAMYGTD